MPVGECRDWVLAAPAKGFMIPKNIRTDQCTTRDLRRAGPWFIMDAVSGALGRVLAGRLAWPSMQTVRQFVAFEASSKRSACQLDPATRLANVEAVEPLLRATSTVEIVTTILVAKVIDALESLKVTMSRRWWIAAWCM